MDSQLTILKRDERGRVRSTPQMRQDAVAQYQRSGLSACAFAKMLGIPTNTFWNWLHAQGLTQPRKRLTREQTHLADAAPTSSAATSAKPVRFLQVCPPLMQQPSSSACVLSVRLIGGSVLELSDVSQLDLAARLIQTLHSLPHAS